MSSPTIAIVGRPNVGKSTLFNRLTRSRKAIVSDQSGVTLDRHYAYTEHLDRRFLLCDTGGFSHDEVHPLQGALNAQVQQAIGDADLALWVVDAKDGITPLDSRFFEFLRKQDRPFLLIANKAESGDASIVAAEFASFGHDAVVISAEHNQGMDELWDAICGQLPPEAIKEEDEENPEAIKVALVGRPNVGKSTLLNQWTGDERAIVSEMAGTTRDTMNTALTHRGQDFEIIDTAGLRRKSQIKMHSIERYAVLRTLQAIEGAHVAILMLHAKEGMGEQDARLLAHVLNQGKSVVIAVNQWDHLDEDQKRHLNDTLDHKLRMYPMPIPILRISAKYGTNVGKLLPEVKKAYLSATQPMSTNTLTKWLQQAQEEHPPPLHHGRTIRARYAHPAGNNPPSIIIHGKKTKNLSETYKRYLKGFFIKKMKLIGTPVWLSFRQDDNPFDPKN